MQRKTIKKIATLFVFLTLSMSCLLSGVVMLNRASAEINVSAVLNKVDEYRSKVEELTPKTEYQIKAKNEMLVYFANIKENFNELTETEKIELNTELDEYYNYMYLEEYLYGGIRNTEYIMSFATMSDVHFSPKGKDYMTHTEPMTNGYFVKALEDAKAIAPDLAGVFVLGDLADNDYDASHINTDLDMYYEFVNNYEYKNSNQENIPIDSIMGNHDIGTYEGTAAIYDLSLPIYLEGEGVTSHQWDKWINGYHFIFVNPDAHPDTARVSRSYMVVDGETIDWLDKTLAEDEASGKPAFVFTHHPKSAIYTTSDAEMTFQEVIEKYPSSVVVSGHKHASFDKNTIIQDGTGTWINQPNISHENAPNAQYYFVEVYSGGVVFRARDTSKDSWITEKDVVIFNKTNEVTYKFLNDDGSLIFSGKSEKGETLSVPSNPIKEETQAATYVFAGWDIDGDGVVDELPATVTENLTAKAVYTVTAKQYTYTFYESDGQTPLLTQTADYGSTIAVPTVENLAGWDIDGDGAIESLPKTLKENLTAVAVISDSASELLTYTFHDGNGTIYKKGKVASGQAMIIPSNPISAQENVYFAGWDIDGDDYPDELPNNGIITTNFDAVAVFFDIDAFNVFNKGEATGFSVEGANITVENVDYQSSLTGKAVKVAVNPNKQTIAGTMYVKIALPYENSSNGVAFWIDAPDTEQFKIWLYKNWVEKKAVSAGGNVVYLMSADGTMVEHSGGYEIDIPANFTGWIVIPTNAFGSTASIAKGDYIRIGFPMYANQGNANTFNANIYVGEASAFNCTVDMFAKQIGYKTAYVFNDYNGETIACGVLSKEDTLTLPTNPVRDGWTFVGWDIDGDGVEDTVEVTGRTLLATAIYNKQFTYKFVDENGVTILEKTADYNSLILPPFRYLEDDMVNAYDINYGGYVAGMRLTEDITFVVTCESAGTRTYDVVFYDSDGTTIISESELEYGATIVLPTAPIKGGYTFKGWTGYTQDMTVNGNMSFVAVYEEIVQVPDAGDDNENEENNDQNNGNGNNDTPNQPQKPNDNSQTQGNGCNGSIIGISGSEGAILVALIAYCLIRSKRNKKN